MSRNAAPTRSQRLTRRRTALLALIIAIIVFGAAGTAFAYWTTTANGTATAHAGGLSQPAPTAAVNGTGMILVSWPAPAGQLSGAQYIVKRISGPSGPITPVTICASATTSCQDSGLSQGTYQYSVTAFLSLWQTTPVNTTAISSAGAATHVVFGQQPSNATAGVSMSPAPTVQILDQYNNVSQNTSSIALTITTNTCGGSPTVTNGTVNAIAGTATFSTLQITKACTGYKLTATDAADGNLTVVSNTFNITAAGAAQAAITPVPSSATASATTNVQLNLQLQDQFGNNTTSSGTTTLTLSTSSAKGFFAATTATSGTLGGTINVAFANGVGTGTTFYGDETAAIPTITAKNGATTWGTTTVTINPGTATKASVTPSPSSATASATTNVQLNLQLQDQFGNNTTSSGTTTLTLSTSSAKGFFAATTATSGTLGGTINVAFANGVGTGTTFYGDETAATPTITAKNGATTWGTTTVTINPGTTAGIIVTNITTAPSPALTQSGSIGNLTYTSSSESTNSGNVLTAKVSLADAFGNLVNAATQQTIDFAALTGSNGGTVSPAAGTSVLTINAGTSTSTAAFTLTRSTGNGKTVTLTATLHGTTQKFTVTLSS